MALCSFPGILSSTPVDINCHHILENTNLLSNTTEVVSCCQKASTVAKGPNEVIPGGNFSLYAVKSCCELLKPSTLNCSWPTLSPWRTLMMTFRTEEHQLVDTLNLCPPNSVTSTWTLPGSVLPPPGEISNGDVWCHLISSLPQALTSTALHLRNNRKKEIELEKREISSNTSNSYQPPHSGAAFSLSFSAMQPAVVSAVSFPVRLAPPALALQEQASSVKTTEAKAAKCREKAACSPTPTVHAKVRNLLSEQRSVSYGLPAPMSALEGI
ncbi:hypothetical protein A6R68_00768 [Neotoma lepida]|uniref:Uncharacterized protein n=1 Tax=Neotoma lepida TaxID=56216 RepID=A0A1A6GWI3_NEOLE|nr:hypothetical protein A6R68_00768 [Neotoma lepida]